MLKKSYKKISMLLLCLSLLVFNTVPAFASTIPAYAQEKVVQPIISNTDKVIYQKAEIKDSKELLERARKNINDIDLSTLPKEMLSKKFILTDKNGVKASLDTSITTQLLNETQTPSGVVQNYALSYLASATSTQPAEQSDASMGVIAYNTIYFIKESNPTTTILLTSVSGGWTVEDSTIGVSSRSVTYGCNGAGPSGAVLNQKATQYPSSNSFNYSTGFTKPVFTDFSPIMGGNTHCKLTRGSSVWYLDLVNTY